MSRSLSRSNEAEKDRASSQANGVVRMSGPGSRGRQLCSIPPGDARYYPPRGAVLEKSPRRAKVAKGSAYFFYDDVNALLRQPQGTHRGEFREVLRAPVTQNVSSWQELVRCSSIVA